MAWKISVSLARHPDALVVVQQMIYAAAKAQGASDLEAYSAARSVDDAIHLSEGDEPEAALIEPKAAPVEIDLEYDEETLTLLVRDRRLPANASAPGVRH